MNAYTPFILNGGILVVAGAWWASSEGYGKLGPVLLAPLAMVLANGLLFFKALRRKETGLALAYFSLALAAAVLFSAIQVPGKIGG